MVSKVSFQACTAGSLDPTDPGELRAAAQGKPEGRDSPSPTQTQNDQTQNVSSAKVEKRSWRESASPTSHFWSLGYSDRP